MKKILSIVLIFLSNTLVQSQENKNLSVSFGKPFFSESSQDVNNISLGINYQNRFSNSFAIDVFYTYAQVNNLPEFIDNPQRLEEEILNYNANNIFFSTDWSRIRNHSLGSKLHFLFVNNNKWSFSLFGGFGYNFSKSKKHMILSFSYDLETLQTLSFENEITAENFNSFFGTYGLQTHYSFFKNYLIGLEVSFLSALVNNQTFPDLNKLPDYYNINLLLGYKF